MCNIFLGPNYFLIDSYPKAIQGLSMLKQHQTNIIKSYKSSLVEQR